MGLSQAAVFILAFLSIALITYIFRTVKVLDQDVVVYSIGFTEFEEEIKVDDPDETGLLYMQQVTHPENPDGNLTVMHIPFPYNGEEGYTVMLVKVLNYNSMVTNAELIKEEKDDDKFWVLISDGNIGTNKVTVEINSYLRIDADVEFYGFKDDVVVEDDEDSK